MLKTLIVDDEAKGRNTLNQLLLLLDAPIDVIGEAASVQEAVAQINNLQPELVFLDIMMQDGTGFDVLEQIQFKNFQLVFVTAFDEYALKAFRYAAFDYITKPIDPDLLQKTLNRLQKWQENKSIEQKIEALIQNKSRINKLALHDAQGIQLVRLQDIIHCESQNNYTQFYVVGRKPILVSRTLKEFDELLTPEGFFRVHQSHLINLNKIKQFIKQDGGYVEMEDGSRIEVSRRKKEELLKILG